MRLPASKASDAGPLLHVRSFLSRTAATLSLGWKRVWWLLPRSLRRWVSDFRYG